MIICVDFDGTIVDHRYPDIGNPVPDAFYWIKEFQLAGAKVILYTMRSDGRKEDGDTLKAAVDFCEKLGVTFWGVNNNPEQKAWTDSPKVYANLYIDDAAFGCPLRENPRMGSRPYVDWSIVGPEVMKMIVKQ